MGSKLNLGIFLLGAFLQGGWGQNITFSFFNPDILAVPIMGRIQLDSFSGNSGCLKIESPFALTNEAEEDGNINIELDCICAFETDFCSGRAQRLVSDEVGISSRRRLSFSPNSFMRCTDVGGVRVTPTSGRPTGRPSRPTNTPEPVPRDVFEQTALDDINDVRADLGLPLLDLDDQLSDDAQAQAELSARYNLLRRVDNPNFGENVFETSVARDEEEAVRLAIDAWAAQERDFDFNRPLVNRRNQDFAQLASRNVRNVGIGVAFSDFGRDFKVVARFNPRGNLAGVQRPFRPGTTITPGVPRPSRPVNPITPAVPRPSRPNNPRIPQVPRPSIPNTGGNSGQRPLNPRNQRLNDRFTPQVTRPAIIDDNFNRPLRPFAIPDNGRLPRRQG